MRKRRVRGHKRRWKQINKWINSSLSIDLQHLKTNETDYVKIWIHPWSGLSLTNSTFPQPIGKTKKKITEGLIKIYKEWNSKLKQLDQPYYLAIWLYDNRFSKSQVVCAIEGSLDFYETTFRKGDEQKTLKLNQYPNDLQNKLKPFKWVQHFDEDHFDNTTVGNIDEYTSIEDYLDYKRWFNKKMKKPHLTTKIENPSSDIYEVYSFTSGNVWIGQ